MNRRDILPAKTTQGLIYLFVIASVYMLAATVYHEGTILFEIDAQNLTISELPYALVFSFLRMLIAYAISVVFAFSVGFLAAKSYWGEKIILPILDVLQSIPIIGFFPAFLGLFVGIFQGQRVGIEIAAILLIFTSQVWNIAFAVYESIKSIPSEIEEAVQSFGVSESKKFWSLYFPASIPRVTYNSILSWSNGWFFLVACEIISVGPIKYNLPGIGNFLARSAEQGNISYVMAGLGSLTCFILFLDFFVWRPLSVFSNRYRYEQISTDESTSDFLFQKKSLSNKLIPFKSYFNQVFKVMFLPISWSMKHVFLPIMFDLPIFYLKKLATTMRPYRKTISYVFLISFIFVLAKMLFSVGTILFEKWNPLFKEVPIAILLSTGRLATSLSVCLIWVLPLVYYCWDKPRARRFLTTIAQIGASLPAIALFPLFILIIVEKMGNGMEIASILLLINAMQWYLLFNCIGGSASISSDLASVVNSFGLNSKQKWRKLVFPSIKPAFVTGAITAWGAGWNAPIVSEYVVFNKNVHHVSGIGSLLSKAVYENGDQQSIVICISAMVTWIIFLNFLFWRPLYKRSIDRYRMDL